MQLILLCCILCIHFYVQLSVFIVGVNIMPKKSADIANITRLTNDLDAAIWSAELGPDKKTDATLSKIDPARTALLEALTKNNQLKKNPLQRFLNFITLTKGEKIDQDAAISNAYNMIKKANRVLNAQQPVRENQAPIPSQPSNTQQNSPTANQSPAIKQKPLNERREAILNTFLNRKMDLLNALDRHRLIPPGSSDEKNTDNLRTASSRLDSFIKMYLNTKEGVHINKFIDAAKLDLKKAELIIENPGLRNPPIDEASFTPSQPAKPIVTASAPPSSEVHNQQKKESVSFLKSIASLFTGAWSLLRNSLGPSSKKQSSAEPLGAAGIQTELPPEAPDAGIQTEATETLDWVNEIISTPANNSLDQITKNNKKSPFRNGFRKT